MGRAVGGASAVGCGVFGVGGLLIGVGLTVWLGSMALSGSTGGTSARSTTTSTTVPALPSRAAIALDQPEGRGDGTVVTVTGTGFRPGPVAVTECLTHAPGTIDQRCDTTLTATIDADAKGAWTVGFVTPRVISVGGSVYDCATAPGVCSVLASAPGGNQGVEVPIAFADGLGPVEALSPPTG